MEFHSSVNMATGWWPPRHIPPLKCHTDAYILPDSNYICSSGFRKLVECAF